MSAVVSHPGATNSPRLPAEEWQAAGWDYRALAFPKNNGLRIDLMLGNEPLLKRCTSCVMHRDERKGEAPSDHVPVVVDLDFDDADDDDRPMIF